MSTEPDPDAVLIALCALHAINWAAVNNLVEDIDDDNDPIWTAYLASRDLITDARPTTMAGVIAKARVTKLEAWAPNGQDDYERELIADWSWAIVNDLLRLHGELRTSTSPDQFEEMNGTVSPTPSKRAD